KYDDAKQENACFYGIHPKTLLPLQTCVHSINIISFYIIHNNPISNTTADAINNIVNEKDSANKTMKSEESEASPRVNLQLKEEKYGHVDEDNAMNKRNDTSVLSRSTKRRTVSNLSLYSSERLQLLGGIFSHAQNGLSFSNPNLPRQMPLTCCVHFHTVLILRSRRNSCFNDGTSEGCNGLLVVNQSSAYESTSNDKYKCYFEKRVILQIICNAKTTIPTLRTLPSKSKRQTSIKTFEFFNLIISIHFFAMLFLKNTAVLHRYHMIIKLSFCKQQDRETKRTFFYCCSMNILIIAC
ncbi:hypothetical protein RFI_03670, partial [Reticulomyxa filosa]